MPSPAPAHGATTLKQSLETDLRALVAESKGAGGALSSLSFGLVGGGAKAEHDELKGAAEAAIRRLRSLPDDASGGGKELLHPFLVCVANHHVTSKVRTLALQGTLKLSDNDALDDTGVKAVLDSLESLDVADPNVRIRVQQVLLSVAQSSAHPKEPVYIHKLVALSVKVSTSTGSVTAATGTAQQKPASSVRSAIASAVGAGERRAQGTRDAADQTGMFTLGQVLYSIFDHARSNHSGAAAYSANGASSTLPQQSVAAVEVLSYLCEQASSGSAALSSASAFTFITEACLQRHASLISNVAPYRVVVADSLLPAVHNMLLDTSAEPAARGAAIACGGAIVAHLHECFPAESVRLLKELSRVASAGARGAAPPGALLASLGALRCAMRGADRRMRGTRLLALAAEVPAAGSPSLLRNIVNSCAEGVRAASGPPGNAQQARSTAALDSASSYLERKAKGADWSAVAIDAWKLSENDDSGGDDGSAESLATAIELGPRAAGASCALAIDALAAIADGIEAACEPASADGAISPTTAVAEAWRGMLRAAEDLMRHRSVSEVLALDSLAVVQSLACASGSLGLLEPRDAALRALCRAAKRPCFAAAAEDNDTTEQRTSRSESMSMLTYGTSMTTNLVATIATTAVSTPARAVRAARELARVDSGGSALDRAASDAASATTSALEASAPLEAINRHALRSLLNTSHRLDAVLGLAWDPIIRTLADVEVRLAVSSSSGAATRNSGSLNPADERETLSMALTQLFAGAGAMPEAACGSLARALARLSSPAASIAGSLREGSGVYSGSPGVDDETVVDSEGWDAPASARRDFAAKRLYDMLEAQPTALRRLGVLHAAAPLLHRSAMADAEALALFVELLPNLAGLIVSMASDEAANAPQTNLSDDSPLEVQALEPILHLFEGGSALDENESMSPGVPTSPASGRALVRQPNARAPVAAGRSQKGMPPAIPVLVPTERDRLSASLTALTRVLHAHGHQLGEGWTVAATVLGRVASLASGGISGDESADGVGDAAVTAAPLVSACLEPLQLMLNDYVAKLPLRCVHSAVWCASQCCAQTADLNASLAACGVLWSACDHYGKQLATLDNQDSRSCDTNSTAPLTSSWDDRSSEVDPKSAVLPASIIADLPAHMLGPSLALASLLDALATAGRDPRPEVRNASVRSMCSVLSNEKYAHQLPTALAHHAVSAVVLPLLGHARKTCAEATRDTRLVGATLGRDASTGKEMRMLVHHSRNSEGKQWDETLAMLLVGACKVVRRHAGLAAHRTEDSEEHLDSSSSRRPQFARSAYQTACGICEWCLLEGNKEVAEAAASALASLLAPLTMASMHKADASDGVAAHEVSLSPLVGRALHSFEAALCGPEAQGTAALATPVADSIALKLLKELRNLCRSSRDRAAFLSGISRADMACICRFVKHAMMRQVLDVAGIEDTSGAAGSTPVSRRNLSNEATAVLASLVPLPQTAHGLWLEMLNVPLELLWSVLHGKFASAGSDSQSEVSASSSLSPALLSYMSRVYRSACTVYANDDVPPDVQVAAIGAVSSVACDLWRAIASTASCMRPNDNAESSSSAQTAPADPGALSRSWSRIAQGWARCAPVVVHAASSSADTADVHGDFSSESTWSCIADAFHTAMQARLRVDEANMILESSPTPASDDDALTDDAEAPLLDALASAILAACTPGSSASSRVRFGLVGSLETRALGGGGNKASCDAADVATRKLFALASLEESQISEESVATAPNARHMALAALLRQAQTACRWVSNAPKPRARWLMDSAARSLEALTELDVFSSAAAVYAARQLGAGERLIPLLNQAAEASQIAAAAAAAATGSSDAPDYELRGCAGGLILHQDLVSFLSATDGGSSAIDARATKHAAALLHAAGSALGINLERSEK